MIIFADTETERFRPGTPAPPLVCVQWLEAATLDTPTSPKIIKHDDAIEWSRWALSHCLVGHNIAYDLAVLAAHAHSRGVDLMPAIFQALAENRITDTLWRQKLADIGRGRFRSQGLQYDLGSVAHRFGFAVDKFDPWRLHYGLLKDVPLSSWASYRHDVVIEYDDNTKFKKGMPEPGSVVRLRGEQALEYALRDPVATFVAFRGQATATDRGYVPALLCDEFAQTRAYFALHLTSSWGLRTSPAGVESLRKGAQERLDDLQEILQDEGLVRADGSRDTKAAKRAMFSACVDAQREPRLTPKGQIARKAVLSSGRDFTAEEWLEYLSLDSDACASCDDPLLEAYTEFTSMQKVLSSDVALLSKGVWMPIHPHYDIAYSGRSTCSRPNTQNPRRLAGVRECYVPRGFAA